MPKAKFKNADLQKVKDKSALFALLRDSLGWPLVEDDESYTYLVTDVGNVNVQQLLPFATDDPWLILFVEFDGPFRRDDVRKALREIRRQQRQYGKYEGKGISDILFICVALNYQEIQFVRFVERGSRRSRLKVFGWNPGTQNENKTVCEVCLPALALEVTAEEQPDWSKARWGQAWDVEKVTRDFFNGFDRLRKETLTLLQPVFGADTESANWATSVQLNRLLFVYFLADQGFLPGGVKRLKTALEAGDFHTWFRTLALEALGSNGIRPEGFADIPYLNGGLFVLHETEQGRDLPLTDEHYAGWLDFLGSFRWTLSENEGVNTISPHILGYLFERYINQKQMGAYYTKEDVTGYICRSTVIPRLFDKIAEARGKRVHLDIGALSDEGNRRYVFPSVKQRAYLPTETPYEYQRRQERLQRLEKADLHVVDDFVTNNLNLELLAEDWLATRKDPAELLAAYDALQSITILDPTVGSGAFLLAALEILAPLYDFALRRMDAMVKEAGETTPWVNWAGELNLEEAFDQKVLADPAESETISSMRDRLTEVAKHENSGYFIRKRILLNNLYGVDVMPEAVEICKLRLYLALVSAATSTSKLEPLPDVDLNFRSGNALVGFATLQEIHDHFNPKNTLGLEFGEEYLIRASVRKIQEINRRQEAGEVPHELIEEVEEERRAAVQGLDRQQAEMRGLASDATFFHSHRPFHWLAEFPTVVVERGGFDCVVGNPPWVEVSKARKQYQPSAFRTLPTGNLYALCSERVLQLLAKGGRFSFIVQLPLVCSDRMNEARDMLRENTDRLWTATFGDRPAKLFEGLENCRSTIFILRKGQRGSVWGTRYHRWATEFRPHLMDSVEYTLAPDRFFLDVFPKVAHPVETKLFERLLSLGDQKQAHLLIRPPTTSYVYYQEAMQYWVKASVGVPGYRKNGETMHPDHGRYIYLTNDDDAYRTVAVLISSLFYAFCIATTDCFHLTSAAVNAFPFPQTLWQDNALCRLGRQLMEDLHLNATWTTINTKDGAVIEYEAFYGKRSKPIMDEIDRALAQHYGLTKEEVEFIINYDIKYRMGREEIEP